MSNVEFQMSNQIQIFQMSNYQKFCHLDFENLFVICHLDFVIPPRRAKRDACGDGVLFAERSNEFMRVALSKSFGTEI